MRSSEVHRLFIQELVQGTFAEASEDSLRATAVQKLIKNEIMSIIEERKEELQNRVANDLLNEAKGNLEVAHSAAGEGIDEVKHLLLNHTESI